MDESDTPVSVDVGGVDDFLQHFGVKGMKWGVRKEKNTDFVIGKENPIYNISADKPRDSKGQVYAAFTKGDIINYRAVYAAQLQGFVGASKVFSNAFDLKGDLKVAGEKAQIEEFKKLWESDKAGIAKTLAESQVDISIVAAILNRGLKIDRTKAYEKRFMEASESYMLKKGYRQFQQALALPENNYKTPYYSLLSQRGYSALLDMNDVRHFNSEKPILIFKGKDHLRNKDSLELSKSDIQLAMETYWDPKNLEKYSVDELHVKHIDDLKEFLKHHQIGGGNMENGDVEDFLQHFGVKGMKWGRRSDKPAASADAEKAVAIKTKAKAGSTKALSNEELQTAINRMQLEQNFKRLSVNEKSAVNRWVSSTLLEIGKREIQQQVAKKLVRKVATGGVA